jgi:hypothetical protein
LPKRWRCTLRWTWYWLQQAAAEMGGPSASRSAHPRSTVIRLTLLRYDFLGAEQLRVHRGKH